MWQCNFIGYTHEGKTQFKILPHSCTLQPPRGKTICNVFRSRVFVTGYLDFYASPWKVGELLTLVILIECLTHTNGETNAT